jgi:hypothetical protein
LAVLCAGSYRAKVLVSEPSYSPRVGSPDDQALLEDGVSRGPDEWLEAVREEERRGELLAAFDLAERGLTDYPGDVRLKHRAVLALARAGATERPGG